jgi:hypothetical protein
MTVLPPRMPVDDRTPVDEPMPVREHMPVDGRPPEPLLAAPAATAVAPGPPVAPPRRRTSPERIVLGLLLAAGGAAWLLDVAGVAVPWALAPAVGVVVIGIALLVTARTPGGHAPLVIWGGILLAVAIALAVVRPTGGPVGDQVLTPSTTQWPVATSMTAGNLTIDLRQNPLPASGRLTADVTAGTVVIHLPSRTSGERVQVVAHVGMGQIQVDGVEVRSGMGLDWTSLDPPAVVVDVHIGTGQLEVDHG